MYGADASKFCVVPSTSVQGDTRSIPRGKDEKEEKEREREREKETGKNR